MHSVYPDPVKMYYIMNSVYNEDYNCPFLFMNIPRVYRNESVEP